MKCRFIGPMKVSNPAYSRAAEEAARQAGVPYGIPQRIEVDAGYTVEDPEAWIHCCPGDMNSAPIAEPADDECRAKVKEWMEVYRPAGIAQIKAQLEQIDLLTNDEDKARLLKLGRAYGLIGGSKPVEVPSPVSEMPTDQQTTVDPDAK